MMDLRKLRYSVRFHVPYFSEAEAFDLAPAARALPGLANLLVFKLEARLEDLRNGICHLSGKMVGAIQTAVDRRSGFAELPDHAIAECLTLVDRAIALANDDSVVTR